jgi:pyridoxine 5-phosphate synthase
MTRLSVNINKIATLRNARGGNTPNLVEAAIKIQEYGSQGITIHPRPDQRHIKYQDAYDLKPIVTTEFNIEGNPNKRFIDLVLDIKPQQVTLVPDAVDAITSNAGWDTIKNFDFLKEVITEFKNNNIRTSIFMENKTEWIEATAKLGANRIELYTEEYAKEYAKGNLDAVIPYAKSAEFAKSIGLGVNAGHDLSLDNIEYFAKMVPNLLEVSIGHALISEALYLGLQNVVNMYLYKLNQK